MRKFLLGGPDVTFPGGVGRSFTLPHEDMLLADENGSLTYRIQELFH